MAETASGLALELLTKVGYGLLALLIVVFACQFALVFRLFLREVEFERKDNFRTGGNPSEVESAISFMRANHPGYFSHRKERIAILGLDDENNVVDLYTKPVEWKDGRTHVYFPLERAAEMVGSKLVSIHQHPGQKVLRASFADAMAHDYTSKRLNAELISVVVDPRMSRYVEYDRVSNLEHIIIDANNKEESQ